MIAGALHFLIQTLGNLFVIAVLLRFMMQLFRVPFYNPFAQFIVAITYYIGTDNNDNKHLYMQSLQTYGGEYTNVVSQLIPNVEDMAIEYGIDTNGDESIDDIQDAQQVQTNANWDKVLSVYLRLLFYTDNVGNTSKPYSFNGVTYDGDSQPLPDDRRFRREFVTTVNLRNRIHYN